MKIKYNTETLQHIITDLSELTGISMAFLDNDFNYLVRCCDDNDYCSALQKYSILKRPCHCSDTDILNKCKNSHKTESHICHAGLCDSAMPIIKNEIIVCYIIFGRIKTKLS
ncbi:MAG: PocR ligand-binding domain-containing protein, partial [Acutalibacteraceae bacterium]|nr:PocR ligand-binding domain-containing protein [Acutalibacteraceae bacterium]